MIFSSANQLNCLFLFITIGIFAELFANIFFIVFLKNYQKNVIKIIFDSIFYTFFSILFIFSIIYFNFGEFSITLLLSYILGIFWIKILTHKLVVFFECKWYNHIKKKLLERKKRSSERKLRKSQASNIPSNTIDTSISRHAHSTASEYTQE